MLFAVLSDWPGGSSYHNDIFRGIESFCSENGISIVTFSVGRFQSGKKDETGRYWLYEYLKNNSFDGVILYAATTGSFCGIENLFRHIALFSKKPLVSLSAKSPDYPSILIDQSVGFNELMDHLINFHGYKDFAFISGPNENLEASERLNIFKAKLSAADISLSENAVFFGDFMPQSGEEAVRFFLSENRRLPQIIVCANDNMAIGAWEELSRQGFSVPFDVALTGFDNIQLASSKEIPFTTVKQPLVTQGYEAAKALFHMAKGELTPDERHIPSKLIIRQSCGCKSDINNNPDNPVDSGEIDSWFLNKEKKLKDAFELFKIDSPGDPLLRSWNSFILDAVAENYRQNEVHQFYVKMFHYFTTHNLSYNKITELNRLFQEMYRIMLDHYQQTDILGRVIYSNKLRNVIESTDSLNENLMSSQRLCDQSFKLENFFRNIGIQTAYIFLFRNISGQKKLCLEFSMLNGHSVNLSGTDYFTAEDFIPEKYLPDRPVSLLTESLFESEEILGSLIYEIKSDDGDTFEIIRRRLSSIIHSINITNSLSEAKNLLEEEIRKKLEYEEKLEKLMKELKVLSLKDELTGLFNRRGFLTLGEQQVKHFLREKKNFVILFADMNGLKKINDIYGHREGDHAIISASRILSSSFREADIIARLGGDEFTVLFGGAEKENIDIIIARIKENETRINSDTQKPYKVSLSLGFASYSENSSSDLRNLMELADNELYRAKKNFVSSDSQIS